MSESSLDRDPFEGVAESFLARFRAGERPSIAEYAARHPELADRIRRLLPALVIVEQDFSVDDDVNAAPAARDAIEVRSRRLGDGPHASRYDRGPPTGPAGTGRVELGGAAGRDARLGCRHLRPPRAVLPERGADRPPGGARVGVRPRPRHRPP